MKNTKRNELAVCGFATVKKLEKNHPEKIRRLYFTEEVAPKFGGLCRKLAKNHGIYGFGIFYYWYSGKKVFEKPLDIIF